MVSKSLNYNFVWLMAAMMSLTALSIDAILPAMGLIRSKFYIETAEGHWIITSVFLGLSAGQVFFGPLSDTIGRKPVAYIGICLFVIGNLIAFFATSYVLLLLGRLLQGIGASAPRVVSQAMIRDMSSGPIMAKMMSFVMTVFIVVPVLAPILGQFVIFIAEWELIFITLSVYSISILIWLIYGQNETLKKSRSFDFKSIKRGFSEVFDNKITLGFMLIIGVIFGGLVSFLNISQPLFQDTFKVGDKFPFYFAVTALIIGISALINSWLVSKVHLETIVTYALLWVWAWSGLFVFISLYFGEIELIGFMIYSIPAFATLGFLFSNVNTLALAPMGHIAGTASATIGTSSNILAIFIGAGTSYFFKGSPTPLIVVFFVGANANIVALIILKQFKLKNFRKK